MEKYRAEAAEVPLSATWDESKKTPQSRAK
jgi:hypothetical protein